MTDKLDIYTKPIKQMCPHTDHRNHKALNNRVKTGINLHEGKKNS